MWALVDSQDRRSGWLKETGEGGSCVQGGVGDGREKVCGLVGLAKSSASLTDWLFWASRPRYLCQHRRDRGTQLERTLGWRGETAIRSFAHPPCPEILLSMNEDECLKGFCGRCVFFTYSLLNELRRELVHRFINDLLF